MDCGDFRLGLVLNSSCAGSPRRLFTGLLHLMALAERSRHGCLSRSYFSFDLDCSRKTRLLDCFVPNLQTFSSTRKAIDLQRPVSVRIASHFGGVVQLRFSIVRPRGSVTFQKCFFQSFVLSHLLRSPSSSSSWRSLNVAFKGMSLENSSMLRPAAGCLKID